MLKNITKKPKDNDNHETHDNGNRKFRSKKQTKKTKQNITTKRHLGLNL